MKIIAVIAFISYSIKTKKFNSFLIFTRSLQSFIYLVELGSGRKTFLYTYKRTVFVFNNIILFNKMFQ